jgi:hypothetical protein
MDQDHVEAMRETAKHIRRVQELMADTMSNLARRSMLHDASKYGPEEWPYFAEATKRLRGLTYGSDEYKASLDSIRPGIEHHQRTNSHHPEHHDYIECNGCFKRHPIDFVGRCEACGYSQMQFRPGIEEMSLLDLLEMLADWKAAGERHADGSLVRSLAVNEKRFKIPQPLMGILKKTATEMGWL